MWSPQKGGHVPGSRDRRDNTHRWRRGRDDLASYDLLQIRIWKGIYITKNTCHVCTYLNSFLIRIQNSHKIPDFFLCVWNGLTCRLLMPAALKLHIRSPTVIIFTKYVGRFVWYSLETHWASCICTEDKISKLKTTHFIYQCWRSEMDLNKSKTDCINCCYLVWAEGMSCSRCTFIFIARNHLRILLHPSEKHQGYPQFHCQLSSFSLVAILSAMYTAEVVNGGQLGWQSIACWLATRIEMEFLVSDESPYFSH